MRTKAMLINVTETYKCNTRVQFNNQNIKVTSSTKLLGNILYEICTCEESQGQDGTPGQGCRISKWFGTTWTFLLLLAPSGVLTHWEHFYFSDLIMPNYKLYIWMAQVWRL